VNPHEKPQNAIDGRVVGDLLMKPNIGTVTLIWPEVSPKKRGVWVHAPSISKPIKQNR